MATWSEFEAAEPRLAAEGRQLLRRGAAGEAMLATVRRDDAPRLHPVNVEIVDGGLYAFILRSAKLTDLAQDGRYALHCYPDPDAPSEFMVRGKAVEVEAHEVRAAVAAAWSFEVDDTYRLYAFDIEQAVLGARLDADDWPPRYSRWSAADRAKPSRAMIRALKADAPHPSLGEQAHAFDRFVGAWDADYTHFKPDGSVLNHYTGRVLFGWILGGRGLQDVWISDPNETEPEGSQGTSIRFYDAAAGLWRVVFILPEYGVLTTVQGGVVGDRIVLEGTNPDGSLRRWSFNEIRADSFVWRGERSEDGGATWSRTAEYHMSRAREE
jgi:hypothetical protein